MITAALVALAVARPSVDYPTRKNSYLRQAEPLLAALDSR
jgi:hypothetical protein